MARLENHFSNATRGATRLAQGSLEEVKRRRPLHIQLGRCHWISREEGVDRGVADTRIFAPFTQSARAWRKFLL